MWSVYDNLEKLYLPMCNKYRRECWQYSKLLSWNTSISRIKNWEVKDKMKIFSAILSNVQNHLCSVLHFVVWFVSWLFLESTFFVWYKSGKEIWTWLFHILNHCLGLNGENVLSYLVHLPLWLSVEKKWLSKLMHKNDGILMTFNHTPISNL